MDRTRCSAGVGRRAAALLGPLLVAACAAPGGGGGSGVDAEGPVVVGVLLATDGELARYGDHTTAAVELAIAEINAAGGAGGRLLVIDHEPGAAAPGAVAESVARLAARGAAAVIGPLTSAAATAAIAAAAIHGVPLVSPSATSPALSGISPWFFRTAPNDAAEGAWLADYAAARGWESAWVVYRPDPWGVGLRDAFVDGFEALSGSVTTAEFGAEGEPAADIAADIVADIVAAAPDLVLAAVGEEDADQMLAAWAEAGAPQGTTWGLPSGAAGALAGGGARGAQAVWIEPAPAGTWALAFEARFEEAVGEPPAPFASQAYDAVWLVALAVAAGDGTPASVRAQLLAVASGGQRVGPGGPTAALDAAAAGQDVDYDGASGSCDLGADHDPPPSYRVGAD